MNSLRGWKYLLGIIIVPFCAMANCFQEEGNAAMQKGDRSLAFSMLKECDGMQGLSGETLLSLAGLYMLPQISHFDDEKARTKKVFELLKMASYKGNEDALVTLSSFFASGEPLLLIKPNEKVESCLLELTEVKLADLTIKVDECMKSYKNGY